MRSGARPATVTAGCQKRRRNRVARIGSPSGERNTRASGSTPGLARSESSSQTNAGSGTDRTAARVFGGPKLMCPPMSTSVSATWTRRRSRSTRPHRSPSISPSLRPPSPPRSTNRPIPRIEVLGEGPQVVGVQEAHLSAFDTGEWQLGDGVVRDQAILVRGVHTFVQQLHDAMDRGRRKIRSGWRAHVGNPRAQRCAVEFAERGRAPNAGSACERKYCSSRAACSVAGS